MRQIHYISFTTQAPYSLKKLLHSRFSSVFLDIGGSLDNKSQYKHRRINEFLFLFHDNIQLQKNKNGLIVDKYQTCVETFNYSCIMGIFNGILRTQLAIAQKPWPKYNERIQGQELATIKGHLRDTSTQNLHQRTFHLNIFLLKYK